MSKDDQEEYLQNERATAVRALSRLMATSSLGKVEEIVRPDESTVAHEILKAATAIQADLIVVATYGKGRLARIALGSVTEEVLRSSPMDVLAIP